MYEVFEVFFFKVCIAAVVDVDWKFRSCEDISVTEIKKDVLNALGRKDKPQTDGRPRKRRVLHCVGYELWT